MNKDFTYINTFINISVWFVSNPTVNIKAVIHWTFYRICAYYCKCLTIEIKAETSSVARV